MLKTVLLIDDDRAFLSVLEDFLVLKGYNVVSEYNPKQGLKRFLKQSYHVVFLDQEMPEMSGIELAKKLHEIDESSRIIMMTAYPDTKSAVRLIKDEILYDYMIKPVDLEDVENTLKHVFNELELELLKHASGKVHENIDDTLPDTPYFENIREFIDLAAGTNLPVLITGETGTGKGFLAKMIHKKSGRKNFVSLNCAAVPEGLFESELFGVEKGAFTGAQPRKGLFEIAEGGSLFLDEIGEMPINLQAKILDAIESLKIRRVGGGREIPVDVRIISATNKFPSDLIKEGKFREDLYYRLNVLHFNIKPLRERKEDIIALAELFASNLQGEKITFTENVKKVLSDYSWPGNIRELKNVIERSHILAKYYKVPITETVLRTLKGVPEVERGINRGENVTDSDIRPISQIEREMIEKAIKYFEGNKSKAAKALGISLSTLKRKVKKYNIIV